MAERILQRAMLGILLDCCNALSWNRNSNQLSLHQSLPSQVLFPKRCSQLPITRNSATVWCIS